MLSFTFLKKALEALLLLYNAEPNLRRYSLDLDIPIQTHGTVAGSIEYESFRNLEGCLWETGDSFTYWFFVQS